MKAHSLESGLNSKAQRKASVYAALSIQQECGYLPDAPCLALLERYIEGELTLKQVLHKLKTLYQLPQPTSSPDPEQAPSAA